MPAKKSAPKKTVPTNQSGTDGGMEGSSLKFLKLKATASKQPPPNPPNQAGKDGGMPGQPAPHKKNQ
jgi:hypothetical protein